MDISVLVLAQNSSSDYGLIKKIFVSDSNLTYTFYIVNNVTDGMSDQILNFLNEHSGYCIVTTNNIISTTTPEALNSYLYTIINNNENNVYVFDICYISKWLDSCFTYSNQFNLDDRGTTLVRTTGPKGFESLLFSPRGVATFVSRHSSPLNLSFNEYLTQDISRNALTAITFISSPVVYNPVNATSVTDYARTTECQNIPPTTNNQDISNMYLYYFILIIVIIFIAAWILFKLAPTLNASIDNYPIFDNPLYIRN